MVYRTGGKHAIIEITGAATAITVAIAISQSSLRID
jgi:hypothetical protein